MNEKKSIAGVIIPIILIIIFIMCAIVYCIFFMNKQTTNPINNEISNIDNSSTKNNNIANTVSEFTMTESEFPKVDGATAMLPMIGEITKSVLNYSDEEAQKYLDENTHGKTAKVYASLINKEKDLIFVSEPSDDILKSAEDNNVEFEMVGIGLDGFVFLVNKENKVDSLTLEQIQKIYTGEITNWSNVGGENEEIVAYQREANSGSQNLMEKMVMQGLKMKEPENTNLMIGSMSGLIDGIASYSNSKNSIGYSIYLYAKEQYVKDNVKFLGQRDDVAELYQAFDVFLLPSLYEGLPVVGVEAQASGLLCYFSNNMTKEAKVLDITKFMSLNNTPEEWTSNILKDVKCYKRINTFNEMTSKNFNIKTEAKKLEEKYENLLNGVE